ncbi:MAG: four helix bundle protein [Candidatus Sumerlaeota bacterium]|nr:four helix bundle protein [Candidatus Sumerlaeota bacterium]
MDPSKDKKQFDLEERLISFALRIMDVVEALPHTIVGRHIAEQLLRSGTSPAPNYAEAQGAESRRDFIHKMRIALKELRESGVWLKMISRKPLIEPSTKMEPIIKECNELIAIFFKSIETARSKDKAN